MVLAAEFDRYRKFAGNLNSVGGSHQNSGRWQRLAAEETRRLEADSESAQEQYKPWLPVIRRLPSGGRRPA